VDISKKYNCIVVLKSHKTSISTPQGKLYFNTTGNPALAVAGSGDVLTGMITGLLAQNNSPLIAAIRGVYLHGLAADLYIKENSEKSLTASILCNYISPAIKETEINN